MANLARVVSHKTIPSLPVEYAAMSRTCTACAHPLRAEIDLALARHAASYRLIAAAYGLADTSLRRHQRVHLAATLAKLQEANNMLSAENLLAHLAELDAETREILTESRARGDRRTALVAIRESRNNVEAYSRIGVASDLERRLDALEQARDADVGGDVADEHQRD